MRSKFLEKEDVVLRPIENDDKEFLREVVNHPEVRKTIGRAPKPANLQQEEDFLEKASEDEEAAYFLIEYEGEKAGTISIHGLENDYRRGEFGVSVHPDLQGQGIGTKAVQMVVRYAFETLNMHKVRGGFLEGNEASRKVMEKAGMQKEGRERHYKYVDGEWRDVIWMSILEEEYFDE